MTGIVLFRVNNPETVRDDMLDILKQQSHLGMDYIYSIKIRGEEVGDVRGDATSWLCSRHLSLFDKGDLVLIRHSRFEYEPIFIKSNDSITNGQFTNKNINGIIVNLFNQTRLEELDFSQIESRKSLYPDIYFKLERDDNKIKFIFNMPMYLHTRNNNVFLMQESSDNSYSKSLKNMLGTINCTDGMLNMRSF